MTNSTHTRIKPASRESERYRGATTERDKLSLAARLRRYGRNIWTFYRIRPVEGVEPGRWAISFDQLFREFVADWRVLATCLLGGLAIAVFQVASLPAPAYEVTLNVTRVEGSLTTTPVSGGGGLGALSFLAPKASQFDEFAEFLGLMRSVRLARHLDQKYGLMTKVFDYDESTKQYVRPVSADSWSARTGRWLLGLPDWQPPGYVDLAGYLGEAVVVTDNGDGTSALTHAAGEPQEAADFLRMVFVETGNLMREERLTSHRNRRAYLAERLNDVSTLEQRTMLMNLWGREESQMLLLSSGDPIGARAIDEIRVPHTPVQSQLASAFLAPLFGLLLGLLLIIVRSALRRV